jgi:cytoskeletal protein RodZ
VGKIRREEGKKERDRRLKITKNIFMTPLQEYNRKKRMWIGVKVLIVLGVLVIAAGAFLCYRRVTVRGVEDQTFQNSDAGYSLTIPLDWRITTAGSSSIEIYPAASSCKIGISSFPAVKENDRAAWIGGRLRADPAADAAERSTEQVSVGGVPAIRWDGTLGGVPTTFVYVFTLRHIYEIAPSIADGSGDTGDDGIAPCEDALNALMANIHFPVEQQGAAFDDDAVADATVAAATSSGSVLGASIAIESSTATSSAATSSSAIVADATVTTTATVTDAEADCL